jgi:hypothetical protein
MAERPPVLRHPNKRLVFEIACPAGSAISGTMTYTRWKAIPLPAEVNVRAAAERVEARDGFYDFAAIPANAVHWHVNFADPELFGAYGSGLFAQDEMQVAEHPVLGALREALVADGRRAVTVQDRVPTPVLVRGVERRCRIETGRNAAEGRPDGLYGNAFARSSAEALRRGVTRLEPPTITNLIAMAAPAYGRGAYQTRDLEFILSTAYTGFRAAVLESTPERETGALLVVHTGFWGCGAFGGNRVLMAALQALAAEMAGLHGMVLHTAGSAGAWTQAKAMLGELDSGAPASVPALIQQLVARRLEWGVSDGN